MGTERSRRALLGQGGAIVAGGILGGGGRRKEEPDETTPVALGVFVPGAPANLRRLDGFVTKVGRMPAFVHWYEAWGSATSVTGEIVRGAWLETVGRRGATPLITWEPWDPTAGTDQPAYALEIVSRSDFDAYINSWAYRLAAHGAPVYLRFAHEMNAGWYPWGIGVNGTTTAGYLSAWRHLRQLFAAAGATNVRWVWSPDAGSHGGPALADVYPGDDLVDWVALDGYNWGTARPDTRWRGFGEVFARAYDEVLAFTDRPVMVAEMACSEQGATRRRGSRRRSPSCRSTFPGCGRLGGSTRRPRPAIGRLRLRRPRWPPSRRRWRGRICGDGSRRRMPGEGRIWPPA